MKCLMYVIYNNFQIKIVTCKNKNFRVVMFDEQSTGKAVGIARKRMIIDKNNIVMIN